MPRQQYTGPYILRTRVRAFYGAAAVLGGINLNRKGDGVFVYALSLRIRKQFVSINITPIRTRIYIYVYTRPQRRRTLHLSFRRPSVLPSFSPLPLPRWGLLLPRGEQLTAWRTRQFNEPQAWPLLLQRPGDVVVVSWSSLTVQQDFDGETRAHR